MIRLSRPTLRLLCLAYLVFVFVAAFWPFDFVAICLRQRIDRTPDGGVRTARCAALSSPSSPKALAEAFRKSNQITIETDLISEAEDQEGPARVFSFSESTSSRNFTLGQQGDALVLRLRTARTGPNGTDPYLEVPAIIRPGERQHLLVTYDGRVERVFVDGKPVAENREVAGDFSNWTDGHFLTAGNERTPNRPWRGVLFEAALYARALSPEEAARNFRAARGREPATARVSDGLVAWYDFGRGSGEEAFQDRSPAGLGGPLGKARFQSLRRTMLENLPAWFGPRDMILNILAFIPIGFFLWHLGPAVLRRNRFSLVLSAAFAGLAISFFIEFFQQFTRMRSPNLLDLLYNAAGGALGGFLAWQDAKRERPWLIVGPNSRDTP